MTCHCVISLVSVAGVPLTKRWNDFTIRALPFECVLIGHIFVRECATCSCIHTLQYCLSRCGESRFNQHRLVPRRPEITHQFKFKTCLCLYVCKTSSLRQVGRELLKADIISWRLYCTISMTWTTGPVTIVQMFVLNSRVVAGSADRHFWSA